MTNLNKGQYHEIFIITVKSLKTYLYRCKSKHNGTVLSTDCGAIAQKLLINMSGCEWPGWKWMDSNLKTSDRFFQVFVFVSQIKLANTNFGYFSFKIHFILFPW